MISPKIAMLTAMMAVSTVGMTAVPALAQFSLDQDVDRNNEIDQSIEQSNEACTNTLVAIEDDEGDQSVDSEQENECEVYQSNEAEQEAEIEDESTNFVANFAGFFD
jgi:acyl-coenzyme A synthetase/AMP-(fatty) acid ligase